nr:outer membrane beta-barrel protein [Hyphomicrobium sulfonivorans]
MTISLLHARSDCKFERRSGRSRTAHRIACNEQCVLQQNHALATEQQYLLLNRIDSILSSVGAAMKLKLTLAVVASLVTLHSVAADGWNSSGGAAAVAAAPGRGVYVGLFGGGGFGSSNDIIQRGTAYFVEAQGGPLAVNATGSTNSGGVGFIGAQVGHEWSYNSLMLPAFEIEGFYLDTGNRHATVNAPSVRLPVHTFENSFSSNSTVFLANMVLSFPTSYSITPYIGGGIGAARLSLSGADSLQVTPMEAGVNHFNSGTSSDAWTFAAQIKAGARLAISSNAYLFGEYRYLYVGSVDQTFGSTVYANHAPTSPWTVQFDSTSYQLATAGVGIGF